MLNLEQNAKKQLNTVTMKIEMKKSYEVHLTKKFQMNSFINKKFISKLTWLNSDADGATKTKMNFIIISNNQII